MITFEYITINQLYAKVVDDLSLPPSAKLRVMNWIGESCEFIYTNSLMVKYKETIYVKDYVAETPCNTNSLIGLFINGNRIHNTNDVNIGQDTLYMNVKIIDNTDRIIDENTEVNKLFRSKTLPRYGQVQITNDVHRGLTYNKRGKQLHFNFPSGEVELYYKGLLKNSNNEVLYPDQADYKESIVHWVWYKAIIAGILKGNAGDALAIHKNFKVKAIGNIEFPSPEEMQALVDNKAIFSFDDEYDITI